MTVTDPRPSVGLRLPDPTRPASAGEGEAVWPPPGAVRPISPRRAERIGASLPPGPRLPATAQALVWLFRQPELSMPALAGSGPSSRFSSPSRGPTFVSAIQDSCARSSRAILSAFAPVRITPSWSHCSDRGHSCSSMAPPISASADLSSRRFTARGSPLTRRPYAAP